MLGGLNHARAIARKLAHGDGLYTFEVEIADRLGLSGVPLEDPRSPEHVFRNLRALDGIVSAYFGCGDDAWEK